MCPEQIRIGASGSDRGISSVIERGRCQDQNRTVDGNSEPEQRQRCVHLQIRVSAYTLKAIHGRRDSQ